MERIEVPSLVGRRVLLATPAYQGLVGTHFVNSLVSSLGALRAAGAEVAYVIYGNSGSVPRTRNQAVASMLAGDFTDLVFVDADMGWRPADLCRLLAWDASVVGATYPARTDVNSRWIVVWPDEIKRHESGLLTAKRLGTGFLRVRRDVFERLKVLHPELKYEAPHASSDGEKKNLFAFFDYKLVENADGSRGHLSEDYYFCDLVRNAGFTIWVDPEIYMEHVGTKVFSGTFSENVMVREVPGE